MASAEPARADLSKTMAVDEENTFSRLPGLPPPGQALGSPPTNIHPLFTDVRSAVGGGVVPSLGPGSRRHVCGVAHPLATPGQEGRVLLAVDIYPSTVRPSAFGLALILLAQGEGDSADDKLLREQKVVGSASREGVSAEVESVGNAQGVGYAGLHVDDVRLIGQDPAQHSRHYRPYGRQKRD